MEDRLLLRAKTWSQATFGIKFVLCRFSCHQRWAFCGQSMIGQNFSWPNSTKCSAELPLEQEALSSVPAISKLIPHTSHLILCLPHSRRGKRWHVTLAIQTHVSRVAPWRTLHTYWATAAWLLSPNFNETQWKKCLVSAHSEIRNYWEIS